MTSKTRLPSLSTRLNINEGFPYGKIIDDGVAAKFDPATVEALRSFKSLRRSMMVGAKSAACE